MHSENFILAQRSNTHIILPVDGKCMLCLHDFLDYYITDIIIFNRTVNCGFSSDKLCMFIHALMEDKAYSGTHCINIEYYI